MLNKTLVTVFALTALLAPRVAFAQEDEVICTSVYGGGQVCGIKTHEPVDSDLGDLNPTILGGGFLLTSGVLLYVSRKLKANISQNI